MHKTVKLLSVHSLIGIPFHGIPENLSGLELLDISCTYCDRFVGLRIPMCTEITPTLTPWPFKFLSEKDSIQQVSDHSII
jgi:hypothetical protein